MNLVDILDATARKRADHPALVWGDRQLTYGELQDASRRAATVFADRGVGAGDRVAVMTLNDPGFVIAAYGLWRLGAVLVPTNHKFQPPEVEYVVRHSSVRVGVCSPEVLEIARAGGPEVDWLTTSWDGGTFDDAIRAAEPIAPDRGTGPDDAEPAEILYTSGTTSAPKGCVMSHRAVAAIAPFLAANIPFTADDRFLLAMPIWHSSPINNWTLTMMYLGATVVLMREYDPTEFPRMIEKEQITAVFGAPIAFLAPIKVAQASGVDFGAYDFSSVTKAIYGAAPLGPDAATLLMDSYQTQNFYQVYGMTETGPTGTILRPHEQVAKAGSVGRGGGHGMDVKVVDFDGTEVLRDGTGEVWMKSDSTMTGYLDNPEATAAALVDGWYHTGDIARVDEDGYYFIVDRMKDMIIVGGENVYSAEVESALAGFTAVQDVAVIGRPHPEWGETVVAVAVPASGHEPTLEELRDYLADKIARFKIPRDLVLLDELPRTPSGKIQKHKLRKV